MFTAIYTKREITHTGTTIENTNPGATPGRDYRRTWKIPGKTVYKLAHHRISEKIHHGNRSLIFRATDSRTGRSVILKFLKNSHPGKELLRDFAREYSITSSFKSDRIVRAYSLEKYGNSMVMILEDCGTVSLASMISTVQKNIAWMLDIAIQLTRALIKIHQKNIIHRDLNPSNIMYNGEKQTITVIDFGRAKSCRKADTPGEVTGLLTTALPYISPEQTGGYDKLIDYRTDLYSLGITLYHLLTGTLPFTSSDQMELIHLHLATVPVPPHRIDPAIPETLSGMILKLISKPQKLRYQTCAGLLADLLRCREEWHAHHAISNFSPGEHDLPEKLFSETQASAGLRHFDQQNSLQLEKSNERTISREITPQTFQPEKRGSGFNMAAVVKASRILTEVTTFPELLKKIMEIMLESSGAQRGVLVFNDGENWTIKAAGSTGMNSIELPDNMVLESQTRASCAIIKYVIQTGRDLISNDAQQEGMFTTDEYVVKNSPLSILCTPLTHRQKVECILYLENNLTSHAFSPGRQKLLHLLGNQAAINIRNSRLFGELEASVRELHQEIEKRRNIQRQLLHSEKLNALGRLSSSIAHEFGNPLMGVKYLLTDFIERPDLDHDDRRLLTLGIEECEQMKKLLKDLGQLNRPTTGKRTLASIHRVMDNVLFFQTKQINLQRLHVVKNYAADLPAVIIIKDQISQVLLSLTINAIDASSPDDGTITITTWYNEKKIFLSITDTGKGIDQRIQNNIFEPFFSTKREEDGTGLSLSTSYGIIKRHGGELTFVSKPAKETTFTLSLPLPQ